MSKADALREELAALRRRLAEAGEWPRPEGVHKAGRDAAA